VFASDVEYRFAPVSIRKLGEDAEIEPLTEIVYVPTVETESKSSANTWVNVPHVPWSAPIAVEKTGDPLEFRTLNDAPADEADVIKYARFGALETYPVWFTRTKLPCAAAGEGQPRAVRTMSKVTRWRAKFKGLLAV
jgi:hypothetical protein